MVDVNEKNTTRQENMIDVLTPPSSKNILNYNWIYFFSTFFYIFLLDPKTEPLLDPEHPIYITNNSIFVQWKVDSKNCSKLNGFLSQFYIELKVTFVNIIDSL